MFFPFYFPNFNNSAIPSENNHITRTNTIIVNIDAKNILDALPTLDHLIFLFSTATFLNSFNIILFPYAMYVYCILGNTF